MIQYNAVLHHGYDTTPIDRTVSITPTKAPRNDAARPLLRNECRQLRSINVHYGTDPGVCHPPPGERFESLTVHSQVWCLQFPPRQTRYEPGRRSLDLPQFGPHSPANFQYHTRSSLKVPSFCNRCTRGIAYNGRSDRRVSRTGRRTSYAYRFRCNLSSVSFRSQLELGRGRNGLSSNCHHRWNQLCLHHAEHSVHHHRASRWPADVRDHHRGL